METKKESAKKLEVAKFLWAGIFNEYYDSILLVLDCGKMRLPAGPVYLADVCSFVDERWKEAFLSRKIEEETGIPSSLIRKKTQPLMATYDVYPSSFREEHSGVIIGKIDSGYITKDTASFYNIKTFFKLVKDKKIDRNQEILILRFFISQDCMNEESRRLGVSRLKEKHK
ncbi:MAG: hypothetical protein WC319_03260 [Candidatus Paceibacterota bacterium]|jgi:hypothetical protein